MQRYSPRLLLLFAVLVSGALAQNWECGSENDGLGGLSKGSSQFFVTLNCPDLMNDVNQCCISHDDCYDKQLGQKHCDDTFCACLNQHLKDHQRCRKLRGVMCKAVQQHGGPAYLASG